LAEDPKAFAKFMQTDTLGNMGAGARKQAEHLINLKKSLEGKDGDMSKRGQILQRPDGSMVFMTFEEIKKISSHEKNYAGETYSFLPPGLEHANMGKQSGDKHLKNIDRLIDNLMYEGDKESFTGDYLNKLLSEVPARAEEFMKAEDTSASLTTAIEGSKGKVEAFEKTKTNLANVSTEKETSQLEELWNNLGDGKMGINPATGKVEFKQPEEPNKTGGGENSDGTVPYKDDGKERRDEFSKNLNQFSGVIGMMGSLTGEEQKTAKIMAKVAQIQLMIVAYERAKMAIDQGGGKLLGTIGKFFTGKVPVGRDGGIMSGGYKSFAGGGVSDGPNSGYGAVLHGKEAVVPLPNNRSIPVEMKGKNNGPVNTTINVNMADGSSNTTSDEETGKEFAQAVNMAVLEEIGKQQRPGGLLAG
jgi:hypothetical protein